jgi:hypothetical protein
MPADVVDRDADIWEPMLAIADMAGGDWPARARVSAVSLVSLSKESSPSLGIKLLADLRTVFGESEAVSTNILLEALNAKEDAPWGDLKGKPLDSRVLAFHLKHYGVRPKQIRIGDWTGKGYSRCDLLDPWSRYLPSLSHIGETSETSGTSLTKDSDGIG